MFLLKRGSEPVECGGQRSPTAQHAGTPRRVTRRPAQRSAWWGSLAGGVSVAVVGCAMSEAVSDEALQLADEEYGGAVTEQSAAAPSTNAVASQASPMMSVQPVSTGQGGATAAPMASTARMMFGGMGGMMTAAAANSQAAPAMSAAAPAMSAAAPAMSAAAPAMSAATPAMSAAAPVMSAAMAMMTWDNCDPAKAAQLCPTDTCAASTLCKTGDGMYETDCVSWCEGLIECVTTNKTCITELDPLCYSNYNPRDPCVDYIDSTNMKSRGAVTGNSDYAGSWGSKAAIALLECACGG